LSNAAKYTREGGNVALQVVTNDKFDSITITVTDNGIGISAKKMKKLFQRFNDGDYRKMHTIGTGLGMALTHDLVSLHGGSIDCESEEDKGTTFTVTLPISKKAFASAQIDNSQEIDFNKPQNFILDFEEFAPEAETEKPMPVSESADEDVYRILVVEDNVELLMLMQTLLSRKYLVTTALNGAAAFDIVKNTDLDLIISDVMMPEMDGNELTRRVKNDPNTSHLPIILLTAKTQEKDRAESMIIGADDYITKPFKMSDLELRINNIIENRKRIRREFKAQTVEESRMKAEMASPGADELFLQKAINCVYDHLADSDFDREAFAAEMGSSASSLYNKLRSITGLNVSAFIRDIRMKEAKRLAQTQPDIRVSDLAYRVGFKDPKYFSTCFKKDFGLQPSEYIEQMAGQ
jgi:CheY-like chemotaxis protein